VAEVPEHLLKRSQERRKALGLPVDGDDDEPAAEAPAPDAGAEEAAPVEEAPAAAASDAGAITEDKGGVPAHLLERARRRKAALSGDAPAPAAGGGGTATATKARTAAAAPAAPTATGPGGHTQRLLTVVKSGSIQQTRAEAQDKVHTWPHLLVIELASLLSLTALVTIFSALVKAPLLGLADVNKTPNPSKAPWYFLGLQELLTMWNPMIAGVLVPGVALALAAFAPYIDHNPSHRPEDRKFAISLYTLYMMFWAILVIIGSFFRGPGFNFIFPWRNGIHFEL
jgi:menaquinol-cytochrome c reductase cytochrome b/c subunit